MYTETVESKGASQGRDHSPAEIEGRFVVFLIGMRINKLWKVWKWAPIPSAMSRMIRELKQRTESGFLGASSYFGGLRQPTLVQYWRSFEQLESYARMPATGLGAAARIVPAAGRKATSAGRAGVGPEA